MPAFRKSQDDCQLASDFRIGLQKLVKNGSYAR